MSEPTAGITDLRSNHSVIETIDRLDALVRSRGLLVFARIDYSGDAARAGLTMPAMQMLIFGNPKAGTPLLAAAPRIGLDLPLKALAWQDPSGAVWLSMNAPDYLAVRHQLPAGLVDNIAGAGALVAVAAEAGPLASPVTPGAAVGP